jgi:hypothetical protein
MDDVIEDNPALANTSLVSSTRGAFASESGVLQRATRSEEREEN